MTKTPGLGSDSRSKTVLAPAEGEGADSTAVASATIEATAQAIAGRDGGGSGVEEPGAENKATSESGDDHSDCGETSPTAASPPSSMSSHRSPELVGWSELLMIDLVLAYFRYYAHRRTGYEGRTFCHRSQVRTPAGFVCAFLGLQSKAPPTRQCPPQVRSPVRRKKNLLQRVLPVTGCRL